ncbi:unnamed protein product, partial [Ascophyllum nodosum]
MKEAKKEADSITKAFRADKGAGQLPEKHAEVNGQHREGDGPARGADR